MPDLSDEIFKPIASATVDSEGTFERGHMIGGKYKILSILGSGGMGTVYLVQQVFLRKSLALKTIHNKSVSEISLQRFQLEAKAASDLDHPNLVHVHDFGLLDDGQPYLVMDLVEGNTFAEYLKQNGPLPVEKVAAFFAPVCFGLLAAHEQGVVHRDIKPGNLMVVRGLPPGADGSIKVVDFGIAKHTSRESGEIQSLTRTGEIFGSPLYMSPEQCAGGVVDHRSDIYSLGCVLFEMLTGTPPHLGPTVLATMMLHDSGKIPTLKEASSGKNFPPGLEKVVAKMLRRSPSERYQNIGLVAHDLAATNTRGGTSAALASSIKPARAQKMVSMSPFNFYLLISATAVVPAIVAWFIGYNFAPVTSQSTVSTAASPLEPVKPVKPVKATAPQSPLNNGPNVDPNELELANFGPIRSSIDKDGKHRNFVFPSNSIGLIFQYDPSEPFICKEPSLLAKKDINVPANLLGLEVTGFSSNAVLKTPSILSKIHEPEFRSLSISFAALNMTFFEGKTATTDYCAGALRNVANWPRLETVLLKSAVLSKEALAALNDLKHLRALQLEQCDFKSADLARKPFLRRLEHLQIAQWTDRPDPIFRELAGSTLLHELRCTDRGQTFSAASLAELRQCPNLSDLGLTFSGKSVDDAYIKAVAEMPSVKVLCLAGTNVSAAQIALLAKCPNIVRIYLSQDNFKNSKVQAAISAANKKVDFLR